LVNTGTAMTYNDSPTDGATATISTAGVYALRYTVKSVWNFNPSCYAALLKNAGTDPGITSPDQLGYVHTYEAYSTSYPTVHAIVYLQSGDVVRPYYANSQNNESRFEIIRIH